MITPRQEEILSSISKGFVSPSNIAKHISCSLPYTITQLQLLQAQQFISKTTPKKKKQIGRPQHKYAIKQPLTRIQTIHNANSSTTNIKDNSEKLFNTFIQLSVQIPSKMRNHFAQYFWTRAQAFSQCQAIGKINIKDDEIELIAIAPTQDLEELRKQISHVHITHDKKQIHFACWVHSLKECETGIKQQDDYYLNMLQQTTRLVDNSFVLKTIQEKL